jgi:hypothetical protein
MKLRHIIGLIVIAPFALLALRYPFWGRTIPSRYQIVAVPPATPDVNAEWTITPAASADSGASQHWTARDTAGDGTWNEITTPHGTFTRPNAAPHRWLIICLDGVPLPVMQALWDEGKFREFFHPTATVSTFPSDTETALTAALHAAPVPGYEHGYFNRTKNSTHAGWWVTLSGYGIPYIRKLDYDSPGWAKAVPYFAVDKSFNADLHRLLATFRTSNQPVFVGHIASSDAMMHVRTAQQARPLLVEFDDALRDIYLDGHGDLGIIVFSDHGNTQTLSSPIPLETFLAAHGWNISTKLSGPRDVVIPSYGLVGFAAVYSQPQAVEDLAEQLRGVEGADLIVSRDVNVGNAATIRAAGATVATGMPSTATLEWSPDGQRYRYTAREGDPLNLAATFDSLRTAGKLDEQGFAADADLFAATSLTHFPDAAARIRAWATGGVQQRSNIMVSLRPGYFHGAKTFNDILTLVSTHGGMEQSATLGFAMATVPLPPATRVGDIIPTQLLASVSSDHKQLRLR